MAGRKGPDSFIKLSPEDGIEHHLCNKFAPGAGITLNTKFHPEYGEQIVISYGVGPGSGGSGEGRFQVVTSSTVLSPETVCAVVDASEEYCEVTLPSPALSSGWFSLVIHSAAKGVSVVSPDGTQHFDEYSFQDGNGYIFVSDYREKWYVAGNYEYLYPEVNPVLEVGTSVVVPDYVQLVLVDASAGNCEITLPHPAVTKHPVGFTVVCVANEYGISLKPPEGTFIFDATNTDLNMPGDAVQFTSNRRDTWYCNGKYATNWYY